MAYGAPVEHTFGVGELTRLLDGVVRRAFADDVWVVGEIAGLDRPASGHRFLRLVEPDPQRPAGVPPGPVLHVVLLARTRAAVNTALRQAGIGTIEVGMQVRLRGRLELYSPQSRVQLRMTGIDPTYTVGALEAERDRLLRVLAAEGLLGRNATRALSPVPLRVGLVTRVGSAAHADFLHELTRSGFGFEVSVCDTRVQGPGAEHQIVASLQTLEARGVEVIALVRGGGDRLDLVPFDSEVLARAVAACSVPVVTGIGHETDRSVADEVAHTATKTPTAGAATLVEAVARFRSGLDDRARRLAGAAGRRLDHNLHRLDRQAARIAAGSTLALARADAASRTAEVRVHALDPARALARGWAILRDDGGRVIRDPATVRVGSPVIATVRDGTVTATVTAIDADRPPSPTDDR